MSEKRYFKNLVNFENCIQLKELHYKMGIDSYPKLPEIKFKRTVEKTIEHVEILPEEVEIDTQLATNEVDLKFDEITKDNEFITHKGRKVAAYIRDQPHFSSVEYGVNPGQGISGYKYHLCNCITLQDMSAAGRERRFFVTKRCDGLFNVNCLSRSNTGLLPVSMQLCGHCRKMLREMGIPTNNFTLQHFFEQHDSYVPKRIKRPEIFKEIQDYSHDHDAVAKTCRKAADYTCQKCGVKCNENRYLLHLHHINGDKSNNYPSNLKILCADCHSNEPWHKHLQKKYHDQIVEISELREQQGILDLNT